MAKITFELHSFRPRSIIMIEKINEILQDYEAQGFDLTLRQLYYQLVARDMIENTQKSYKRIGSLVGKARMSGLIDWDHLVDRTRNIRSVASWESPAEIIRSCAYQFKIDLWEDQPRRVEVWIEKDALIGVFEGVCNNLRLPLFSCRGYSSLSEMYEAGRRIASYETSEPTVILHFGDHDPSGIDMTRDITDRVNMFAQTKVEIRRVALTMDQINEHNPPPNPAKITDSRASSYIKEFGRNSWELDALTPSTLESLVTQNFNTLVDRSLWEKSKEREENMKLKLSHVSENWESY